MKKEERVPRCGVTTARRLVMLENITAGIRKNKNSTITIANAHLFALSL